MHGSSNGSASLLPSRDIYGEYGCQLNALTVDDLFRNYVEYGFLYPAKMQPLAPFMALVRENWERALRAGDQIHYGVSTEQHERKWASISSWRSTTNGWHTQHLVGRGVIASAAVMLATAASRRIRFNDSAHQNWFQRSNRFANKVFGSAVSTLGQSFGWVGDYGYVAMPLTLCPRPNLQFVCRIASTQDQHDICQLATTARSPVFVTAEGLDQNDLTLVAVDELYKTVGLRRYRIIVIAQRPSDGSTVGVALAYRGPLGFSFSFLENRCDLIVSPALSDSDRRSAVSCLLAEAANHYADFQPGYIPIVADQVDVPQLIHLGAKPIRDYAQSIALRGGFDLWYQHVHGLYENALQRHLGVVNPFANGISENTP